MYRWVRGLWTHAACLGGEGPPLVVVPGLGCASWMYLRLGRLLAHECRVYLYDPPGHGLSEGQPRCIEELTDHLAAWLRAMGLGPTGSGPLPLLGHSLGGEVVIDLAARYPGQASALIACAPTGIPENPHVTEQFWRLLRDLPRERPALWRLGWPAYRRSGLRTIYALARDQHAHQTGPLLPRVQVPTLLLDGSRDPVIQSWTVQALCSAMPDAVTRIIAGAPHGLTDHAPEVVAAQTLGFLKAVEKRPLEQ